MAQKLRVKIRGTSERENVKIRRLQGSRNEKLYKNKVKNRFVMVLLIFGLFLAPLGGLDRNVQAINCPDVRVVFARGSGGAHNTDKNFVNFRDTIQTKLATTNLTYETIDLDYPAVGVGLDNFLVTLGALIGGGEAYTFGNSVAQGSNSLIDMINNDACSNTKYLIGGYSQGAIVISKSLPKLNSDKILYAATFGDPKIYLPEGKGPMPDACRNQNLSDYRMYVPDCQTYHGMLGGYVPYEPSDFIGKLGTWCNKHDFFCSPFLNMNKHSAYVADNLYEDASRVMFDKVLKNFSIDSKVSSPHDTAIVIDSSASMESMIDDFKKEALRLARETFESGGRVALYDYRDLKDPYEPVEHCDFNTCTMEIFEQEISKITVNGGGDMPESLLSTSLHVMNHLNWQFGATKSLVVLTDANFLSPDRDGSTFDQVVNLSRTIDPVNFYIITSPNVERYYTELAKQTDGKVVTNFDELSLLTDYIIERYDSLPRVELDEPVALPSLKISSTEKVDDTSVRIKFQTTGIKTLVALNDAILGITDQTEIIINELKPSIENSLILVPMNDVSRGESVTVELNDGVDYSEALGSGLYGDYEATHENSLPSSNAQIDKQQNISQPVLLKAPNTGKVF